MTGRIFQFVKKEFIELVRDRKTLAALIGMPTLLLVIFTYAARTDIENLPVAVLDMDRSGSSRELTESFFETKYFEKCTECRSYSEVKELLDKGGCFMALVIPTGFERDLKRSGPEAAKVQLIIDGSIPPTAEQAAGYGRLIAADFFGANVAGYGDAQRVLELSPVDMDSRVLYNPELDAILFMIPGLIGYLLTFLTIMLAAMAVIRERESGTFDQLLVTPLRGLEIIVGKLIPFGMISIAAIVLIMAVSVWWFGMVIRGSMLVFGAGILIFVVASLSFGFFISSVSKNQVQAAQLTIFYMLPSLILSGMYFPVFSMPDFFRWVSYLIPLKYFLVIMRGVTLKGVGFASLWPDFAGITVFLLASIAATSFKMARSRT